MASRIPGSRRPRARRPHRALDGRGPGAGSGPHPPQPRGRADSDLGIPQRSADAYPRPALAILRPDRIWAALRTGLSAAGTPELPKVLKLSRLGSEPSHAG